ncbi:BON domain-containing protein [Chitinimonas naiadis]
MQQRSQNTWLAFGLVLTTIGGATPLAAPLASQDVIDARQETQIWTTFALNPHLRANELKVTVLDGKATLTGKVEEGVTKELAKQIALGVAGIKEVDNQIEVQPDYRPPTTTSNRSYGESIEDATITAAVKSKLLWSKYANGLSTEVETRRGKVTLQGKADSAAAKELASRLAQNTRGVQYVDNQLIIVPPTSTVGETAQQAASEAGMGITDSWITTKVKSTFLYSNEVAGNNITVNTHGGIVTLTGKLNSGAERALAVELAKNVRGVKRVRSSGLIF